MRDKKEIERIAALARIEISESEKDYYASGLGSILEYIDKLKEAEVEAVEPLRGLHFDENVFRPDEPKLSLAREDILNNAPLRDGDYFKIPKVID